MGEAPRSTFRPSWLIGGAAIGILGICALISVGAAAMLIWFSSSRTSNSVQATQSAIRRQSTNTPVIQTSQPVNSPTPLDVVLPTTLPMPGTTPIAPTGVVLPTQNAGQALAPEQAVRTYYSLVSEGRYDLTWTMLTDAFKQRFNCCAPNYNFTGYVQWWDSVNRVEFGNLRTVSQNGDRAVVYAELYYVMNNGDRSASDTSPYIALVYDAAMGNWRFDDKRANP